MIKNITFYIISPSRNCTSFANTVNSLKDNFINCKINGIIPSDTDKKEYNEFVNWCQIYQSKYNISSFINDAVRQCETEYVFISFEGKYLKHSSVYKFIKNYKEKGFLYSINKKNLYFIDNDMCSMYFKIADFKDVGYFNESFEDINISKMIWFNELSKKGYVIKGLIGTRI